MAGRYEDLRGAPAADRRGHGPHGGTSPAAGPGASARAFAIGAGAAVFGLLPWIISGMRLPVQNLWATETTRPQDMPIALLPFGQYDVALISAMLLFGGALAGVLFRTFRIPRSIATVPAVLVGVLVVDLTAIVQSAVVTGAGLRRPTGFVATLVTPEQVYLFGLVAIAALAGGFALIACVLVAAVPVPGPMIGIAIAATTVTSWADALVVEPTAMQPNGVEGLLEAFQVLPGLVTGVAVGLLWRRPFGRCVAGAVVAFGLVWLGPALSTALSGALGSRALLTAPSELVTFTLWLFDAEARSWEVWSGILLGIASALALAGARAAVRHIALRQRRSGRGRQDRR